MVRSIGNYKLLSRPAFNPRRSEPIDLRKLALPDSNAFQEVLSQGLSTDFPCYSLRKKYEFVLETNAFLLENFHNFEDRATMGLNQQTELLLYRASQDVVTSFNKVTYYTEQFKNKDRSQEYFAGLMDSLLFDFDALEQSFNVFFDTHMLNEPTAHLS